jgi:hypothetical protein
VNWLRSLFRRRREPPPSVREGWFERLLSETHFLRKYPQFAGVIARMIPIATNVVPIMAVGLWRWDEPQSRLQFLVNVEYFDRHPEWRAGILLHEIRHVILGHLSDSKFHAVRYPRLMELAMELSADEFIVEPMPPSKLTLAAFASHGIGPRQSTLERYWLLVEAYQKGALRLQDWWQHSMRDTHRPCKKGASRAAGLGDLLDARSDGASERNWNRESWRLGPQSHPLEIERMKKDIAAYLAGEPGGADAPPVGGPRQMLAKELQRVVMGTEQGSLDWRQVLREAFPRRRHPLPNYLRPNRRFPARVGEIPGRSRRPPKLALWIGIDTSGSMSGANLDLIAREIERLSAFARLTLVECDAAVHRIYPLPERLGPFVGGGDTDFAPVFEAVQGERAYDGVIYFTDGKGAMPGTLPPLPTLWALTNEDPFRAPWGKTVVLPSRLA